MIPIRWVYLALAILGAVLPMRHFIAWFNAEGYNLGHMIDAWFVNEATSGLVWDLTIAAIALVIWVASEVWVRRDYWLFPVTLVATFCIGVSCGFPLYLYLRSRPRP